MSSPGVEGGRLAAGGGSALRLCYVANPGWPHVEKWARWFAAQEGYEVHMLSQARPSYGEVKWTRFDAGEGSLMPWIVRAARAFRKAFDAIRPDVVHLHNLEYASAAAAWAWNGPLVLTAYGLDITLFDAPGSSWRSRFFKRMALRRAGAVTAASRFLADMAARIGGLAPEKVHVTPFGVDAARLTRSAPRNGDGWVTVGMPKDLKAEYAPLDFIRAMAILAGQGFKVRGYVQGEGPQREEALSLVRELGVEDRVEIRPRVPLEAMKDVYEGTDICVLPSLRESFGVAALEAQSMEIPVVATPVEGLAEVFIDGVTGLCVPPGEPGALALAIGRLAQDPGLRREMGQAGRWFVLERFDWPRCAKIMDGLYGRLARREGGAR